MEATLYYGAGHDAQADIVCGAPLWSGSFKFYLTTGIATALPTTASVPVLYNPAVPTVVGTVWAPLVVLRIMAVRIGVVSGTVVAGNIRYGLAYGTTFSGTSNGPTPINGFIGRGAATPAGWYTVATASAAPTIVFPSGFDAAGNSSGKRGPNMVDDVGGSIVLPPGSAFWPYLANGAAAPALTALVAVDVIQTLNQGIY